MIPWLRYKPTAQAVEKAKKMFMQSAEEAGKPITPLQAERYVQNILEKPRFLKVLEWIGHPMLSLMFQSFLLIEPLDDAVCKLF